MTPIEQSAAGERLNRSMVMGVGAAATPINAGGPSYFEAKMGTDKVNLQDDADAGANAVSEPAPPPAAPTRSPRK